MIWSGDPTLTVSVRPFTSFYDLSVSRSLYHMKMHVRFHDVMMSLEIAEDDQMKAHRGRQAQFVVAD